jgi:N6-adenosine-specific RNA methylase IME4
MAKLPINKIKVRNRYRKNLGDISSLAASIKEVGLLHPIVVRPGGRLIAGERRLRACKSLGWKSVPVTYVDLKNVVKGEFAENAHRKDFLPSEIDAIRRAIEPYEKKAAKERQRQHGNTAPGRKKHSGKVAPSVGRTRDKVSAFAGISGRTLEKIRAIIGAAKREPRKFGPLVDEMDRTKRVDGVYRKLRRIQDELKTLSVAPVKGQYRTIVVDPPWKYDADQARKTPQLYATMTKAELLALPVRSWAEEDCHLYLWATNHDLRNAFELMEAWGFRYVTTLTWVKTPAFGLGAYFRNTTEHCLFGVRGKLSTRVKNIGTHFIAPKTSHSAKPHAFYEIVERASFPPFLDVFARKERRDWTTWGAGVVEEAA